MHYVNSKAISRQLSTQTPMIQADKLGRNDPCYCGSGKKYKQCCMQRPAKSTANPAISHALSQAISHFERGNFQVAVTICQRILQSEPSNHSAMTLLGVLAFYAGNIQLAIQLLERSIALQPSQPDAHNNLGEIYRASGNYQHAFASFEKALKLNPQHVGALVNYGNVLQDVYQYENAISAYQRALKIQPDHAGALSNLANVYQQLYRHEDAIATFTRLLAIAPDYDWARGGRMYSRIHCCDWESYEEEVALIAREVAAGKRPIKVFELRPMSDSPELELKCARTFAQAMYPTEAQPHVVPHGEKIKVAYVSGDFRQHPVSQLLVEVLEQHDRSKFEIIGISLGPDDKSEIRSRITQAFDRFIDVRQQSDQQVAELLRSMNVQIAVDLMGYTTHARPAIFAKHAAPIQIGYLGYAGTTGAEYMDFIIADDVIIPEAHNQYFSEKVLRLPRPLLPRDTKVTAGAIPTRSEARLPEHGFVFCAFNNHYKITPRTFDVWMRLLQKMEDSVLWLSDANPIVKNNLRKEAERRGISADRIVFAKRTEKLEDHLARHALADLFLDTLPYNAHTTASDALWAGLPVVTCMGKTFAARVAASLLQSLELPQLMTESLEAYEKLALELALDADRLAALKAKLAANKVALPAFDACDYARNLEQVYLQAMHHDTVN